MAEGGVVGGMWRVVTASSAETNSNQFKEDNSFK